MYDNRKGLKSGSIIKHNSMEYVILDILGMGGNAIVYVAVYRDSLSEKDIHKCIIKELFPYDKQGQIYRDDNDNICYDSKAKAFFEISRQGFMYGNSVHIDILKDFPDSVGMNINSFEANNTIYTVLGINTISDTKEKLKQYNTLESCIDFVVKLLRAINIFHSKNILHLDISVDNIIISSSNGIDRVLLIDYNSCYREDDTVRDNYFSINADFSAPELKLPQIAKPSRATDLYSVCIVFVYALTGEVFKYSRANLSKLLCSDALKEASQPVKSLLAHIVTKATRTLPVLRYQTAEEMIADMEELSDRINNVGVTHSSLWQTSKRLCKDNRENMLDNSISFEDRTIPFSEITELKNVIVTGEGGIGKTTMLKRLWSDNIQRYSTNCPIYFYIPLYKYNKEKDFLKSYIIYGINFNEKISTIEEGVKALDDFLSDGVGSLYLLLDGYDEASVDRKFLNDEINELSQLHNVGIVLTARGKEVFENNFSNFKQGEVMPLDNNTVKNYLNEVGIPYPQNEKLRELIKNPFMLKIYAKTEIDYRQRGEVNYNEIISKNQLINNYIQRFAQRYKDNEEEYIKISYILDILLPALCKEASRGGNNSISYKRLIAICDSHYKRLKTKAFSKAYKKYMGRFADIMGDTNSKEEWIHTVVNKVLIRDTALLVEENETYRIVHANILDVLCERYRDNRKKYLRAVIGVKIPVAVTVTSLLLLLAYGAYYFTPGNHPIGKREYAHSNVLVDGVALSVYNVTKLNQNVEKLLKYMEACDREAALNFIREEKAKSYKPESYSINFKPEDYTFYGINEEALELVYSMPESYYNFLWDLYGRLEYALYYENEYSDKDIGIAEENLREYVEITKKLLVCRISLVERSVNKKVKNSIGNIKSTSNFFMDYSAEISSLSDEEIYKLAEGTQGYLRRLKNIEGRLKVIQGEINEENK